MIVLVSDLHLMDGTVGSRRLPSGAFHQTLVDLARCAADAKAQEVTIVFLGDVFDLITTTAWFHANQWPWDDWRDPSTEKAAQGVLQGILEQEENDKIGKLLSGDLKATYGFPKKTTRVYVPGNHDRLCNLPTLRPMVREFLGCPNPANPPFANTFSDRAHGIFARHGHEWDEWNFEGSRAFSFRNHVEPTYDEYMEPPIGDLLTIKVASQLPGLVEQGLESCPKKTRDEAVARMWEVFDVKPLPAIIPWLVYQAGQYGPEIRDAIDGALHQIAGGLRRDPFVRKWLKKHDRLLDPRDNATLLRCVMALVELQGIDHLDTELKIFERCSFLLRDDNHAGKAEEDLRRLSTDPKLKGLRYIAYGHTHDPQQRALDVAETNCDCVYLNTGTWRPVCEMSVSGRGFPRWNTLTYTILYQPGEIVSGGKPFDHPTFEVWSGSLKDV